jgi:hypothetical protein
MILNENERNVPSRTDDIWPWLFQSTGLRGCKLSVLILIEPSQTNATHAVNTGLPTRERVGQVRH